MSREFPGQITGRDVPELIISKFPNLEMLVRVMVSYGTPGGNKTQNSPYNEQAAISKIWQHDTIDGNWGREVSHLSINVDKTKLLDQNRRPAQGIEADRRETMDHQV